MLNIDEFVDPAHKDREERVMQAKVVQQPATGKSGKKLDWWIMVDPMEYSILHNVTKNSHFNEILS